MFNKIAVGLNNDGETKAGLDAIGMSIVMSLKFAPDKKALQHKFESVLEVLWPTNFLKIFYKIRSKCVQPT